MDPWDGVNLESYMAIDFIELAVNQDSLGGFGVNPEDRRFEEIRIGDIDGFGWGDGAALAAHDPAVASANDDLVNLPAKLPMNRDAFGLLASGDFLPDVDGDGFIVESALTTDPGDDWDRRSAKEAAGTLYTGRGYTPSDASFFQLGSQYTDITLSKSYSHSAVTADPVLTGDLARTYGDYPAADGNSTIGSNLPGEDNNHPFYFNFYVGPFAIDPAKPLYLTMTHGDLDTSLIQVEVRDIRANSYASELLAAGTTDDGAIESSFVVFDGDGTLGFDDIFTWDANRGQWHGYLEVRFQNISSPATDAYFALDFLELSTSQKNIAVPGAGAMIRVPEDFATIQAAINVALDGSTILVAPGQYHENLDMIGKNIVLRSHDPLDPTVVAATIIDGDLEPTDGIGDGPVITFRGTEDDTAAVRGFTVQNGKGIYGGGILGAGSDAAIEFNIITSNSAPYGGGIAYCRGLVRLNEIYANTAYVDTLIDADTPPEMTGIGGGVYNGRYLWQNDIHDNSAVRGGGGIWDSGALGSADIKNNLIHHNSVSDNSLPSPPGAGAHLSSRSYQALLVHNTVVDNTWNSAVINIIDESTSGRFFNNILWDTSTPGPTAPNTDWDRLQDSDLRFNVVGGAPSKGSDPMWNIGNDPAFVSGATNFKLEQGSPAIDAGIEFIPPILLDYSGTPREASTPDIGAYESAFPGQVQGYVYISLPSVITEGNPLVLNAYLSDALQELVNAGSTLAWQWQLNGVDITGATNQTFTIDPVEEDDAGDYTVVATIDGTDYVSGPSTLDVSTYVEGGGEVIGDIIDVTPDYHWLDWVDVGEEIEVVFALRNMGYDPVTWTVEVLSGNCELGFGEGGSYELASGAVAEVPARVTPNVEGTFGGEILFSTSLGDIRRSFAGNARDPSETISVSIPTVRITEIQSVNPSGPVFDEDSNPQPWIELHNYGQTQVDISGWALSDDPDSPYKWSFPDGVVLDPDEYLIAYASGLDRRPAGGTPALHTSFTLNSDGGTVILSVLNSAGQTKSFSGGFSSGAIGHTDSYVSYPALSVGTSFAYFGTGSVAVTAAGFAQTTPGGESPGGAAPQTAMKEKTWFIKPYRMKKMRDVPELSIPDGGPTDTILTFEVVDSWAQQAKNAIVGDDSFSAYTDVACSGVNIVVAPPLSHTSSDMLPEINSSNDGGVAINSITQNTAQNLLIDLNINHRKTGIQDVYTLIILDIVGEDGKSLGIHGVTVVSQLVNGIALAPQDRSGNVKNNFKRHIALGHELGHYVGIAGHIDMSENPSALMSSTPYNIEKWEEDHEMEWPVIIVNNTKGILKETECKYFKGIWNRESYYDQYWPAEGGKDNEYFSIDDPTFWNALTR